jgi:drug/metabolite transporter (DMT)-like permease
LTQRHPLLGAFYALLAAFLFGINGATSKVAIATGLTPEQVVSVRTLTAAILALSWALARNPKLLLISPKDLPRLMILGVIGVGGLQWSYSIGVSNLPVGIALLIEYTAVIMIPIATFLFFGEKARPQLWLGAAMVIIGLVLVSEIWGGGLNATGAIFAFGAALCLTYYFIGAERIQRRVSTTAVMVYAIGTAAVLFFIFADWGSLAPGTLSEPVNLMGNLQAVDVPQWWLMVWLGIMGAFFPMLFTYLAVRHISSTAMGVISTSEVLFAFLFGFLWLGETIGVIQTLGGIVVLSGIFIAQTSRVRRLDQRNGESHVNSRPNTGGFREDSSV